MQFRHDIASFMTVLGIIEVVGFLARAFKIRSFGVDTQVIVSTDDVNRGISCVSLGAPYTARLN